MDACYRIMSESIYLFLNKENSQTHIDAVHSRLCLACPRFYQVTGSFLHLKPKYGNMTRIITWLKFRAHIHKHCTVIHMQIWKNLDARHKHIAWKALWETQSHMLTTHLYHNITILHSVCAHLPQSCCTNVSLYEWLLWLYEHEMTQVCVKRNQN